MRYPVRACAFLGLLGALVSLASSADQRGRVVERDGASGRGKNYVAYWSIWALGDSLTTGSSILSQLAGVTHLVLAFPDMTTPLTAPSANTTGAASAGELTTWAWQPYSGSVTWTPAFVRSSIIAQVKAAHPSIQVYAAVGGWNLDKPFPASLDAVDAFATSVVNLAEVYGLDGIDIDWEYPGGNGASYRDPVFTSTHADPALLKQVAVSLAQTLKSRLGGKGLTWAMPGRPDDVRTYDADTISGLAKAVDYFNVMTYDYMNRRDNTTNFHAGGWVIQQILAQYVALGMDPSKANIGFPMYAKWFAYNSTTCTADMPINCTVSGPYEAVDGVDTGVSGTYVYDDAVRASGGTISVPKYQASVDAFLASAKSGASDKTAYQASAFLDTTNQFYWTWVSPQDVTDACKTYLSQVAGVMAWSINQDEVGAPRFAALAQCVGAT